MSWNRQVPCSHKGPIGCVLTATAACCSCSDHRSIATSYQVYVDGEGMLSCGSRWQSYCWKCRGSTAHHHHRSTDYWITLSTPEEIQQSVNNTNHSFGTGASSLPPPGLEGSAGEAMPSYAHSHPNGLGASWWALDRTSSLPTNSYGYSNGLYDTTNRPQQQRDHEPRQDRDRPRMRQRPHIAPLGTREDVENEDYVSPLSSMFHRAHDRYRVAEETRRQAHQADQYMAINDENAIPNPLRSRRSNATDNYAGQHEFPEQFNYAMPPAHTMMPPQATMPNQAVTYPWIQNAHAEFNRRRLGLRNPEEYIAEDLEVVEALRLNELRRREQAIQLAVHAVSNVQPTVQIQVQQPTASPQTSVVTFENQQRPSPKASEDMVVNIACTICAEHPINVVLLPCWHACMCNWCADLCVPVRRNTPFARPPTGFTGKCPKCRTVVKERREMFLG